MNYDLTVNGKINTNIITGLPAGRMSASAQTGFTSIQAKQVTSMSIASGYGFVTGGVTYSTNALTVPTTGYYQINASIGWSNTGGTTDPPSGVYQVFVENVNLLEYILEGSSYIQASENLLPECTVVSDIIYLTSGTVLALLGYNGSPGNAYAGASSGPINTYLSLHFISQ